MTNEVIKGFSIELGLDTLGVEQGLSGLNRTMKRVNSEMDRSLSAFGRGSQSMQRYESTLGGLNSKLQVQERIVDKNRRNHQNLTQEYDKNRTALSKAERTMETAERKMDKLMHSTDATAEEFVDAEEALRKAEQEFGELNATVDKTRKELDEAEISLNKAEREFNKIEGSIDRTTERMKEYQYEQALVNDSTMQLGRQLETTGQKITDLGDQAFNTGKRLTAGITVPILGAYGAATKAAIDWETAFAGVRKTVDASEEEYAALASAIREMSLELPASANEIAAVAESAGQLGISKDYIMDFTRTIIDLSEATNMTSEEAANALARFANIMRMSEEQYSNFGSSIVELGNNMATTESEIMEMALRLAGVGNQIGLTEAEVTALAASMSSVGIEAEAGGSAMTAVMKKMQNAVSDGGVDLEYFAAAAKMSTTEFADAFNEKPMDALIALVEGLEESGASGENLNGILENLGIKGIRESDALLRLAGNSEILSEAVDMSSDAFEENTALQDEAAQRYATTEAQIKMLKNSLVDLGIDMGEILLPILQTGVDNTRELIAEFKALDDDTKELVLKIGGLAAALGPLAMGLGLVGKVLGPIIKVGGKLIQFFRGSALAAGIFGKGTAGAATAATTMGASLGKTAGIVGLFGKALTLLSNPIGWVVGGIAALGGGFALAYNKVDWFRNVVDLTWDSAMIFFDTINDLTGMNALVDWFGDTWQSTEDFRLKVGETMGNVTDWIGETFNEYIKEPFENFKAMHREAGETVEVFDGDVSEATQSVLESYVTLSEEARLALDTLYYSQGEVTQAMVDDVVTKYQAMHDEASTKMEERREMEIGKLTELLEETDSITESDREYRLQRAEEHFNTEEQQLTEVNERIQQIISEALSTEEGLQEEHYIAIEELQNNHNLQTVETLSQGEVEQQTIIERMKTNQLATSEETVKQLIADAKSTKEQTVSEAAQKRDDTIAEAIRQRDETGLISAEEADKIIAEAEREYLESVDKAESRYGEVLTIAQNQASEHGIIVDGETGDILNKWDLFAIGLEAALGAISTMAKRKAGEIASSITSPIISGLNWLIEQFNKIPNALGSNFRIQQIGQRNDRAQNSANTGYTPIAAYSNGTNYHHGGAALLGDVGRGNSIGGGGLGRPSNTREIVELPNKKRYMVDGNVIWPNFPTGAKVKNNRDTEKELSSMGATGGSGSLLMRAPILTGPTLAGQNKVVKASHTFGEMVRNIYDYLDDPAAVINQLMSEAGMPGAEVVSEIGGGMLNKLTQPLIDKVTSLFEAVASTGDGSYILNKKILQYFGRYGIGGTAGLGAGISFNGGRHYGIDTAHHYDPLYSPVNGQVTRLWNDFGGGNSIEIKSGRDYWWFMHLSKILTSVGNTVKAGQRIGTTGNTGNWTVGSGHLHTQYMPGAPGNTNAEDPLPVLRRLSNKGSFENGGIISSHGYYEGAEGNKPEMVIPLTNKSRAIDLMFQAMSLMGGGNNQQSNDNGIHSSEIIKLLVKQVENQKIMIDQFMQIIHQLTGINMKDFGVNFNELKNALDEDDFDNDTLQNIINGKKRTPGGATA